MTYQGLPSNPEVTLDHFSLNVLQALGFLGCLDGTNFSDDFYDETYPEIWTYREELEDHGEFIPDQYEMYKLTSSEMLQMERDGHLIETQKNLLDKLGALNLFEKKQRLQAEAEVE